MDSYLKLIGQIGEGAFSKLYSAYDLRLNKHVALKVEKNNDKKSLLKNEFEIYSSLNKLSCIPKIYNYIPNITNEKEENKYINCIEMELLGKNLFSFKKTFKYYNNILAYDILLQCLKSIKNLHDLGYIHRDIKPSNFCLRKDDEKSILINYKNNNYFKHNINVYLIDFGLVKKLNLNEEKTILQNGESINRGFVGTLTYASLAAHNNEELSKKDDLWSFFFMLLDLLNEKLPWRNYSLGHEKAIFEIKQKCLDQPEKYLFLDSTKNCEEIMNIFNYIKNLKAESEPDYEYILNQLFFLKNKEIQKIYYNYEIKNQILNLQKNLVSQNVNKSTDIEGQNLEINSNFHNYNISPHDYLISKLNKTCNKSIPSLNSTNYTTSLYYKTNYINCISGNNNENFYQSVLKLGNNKSKSNNNISPINKQQYDYNKNIVNIHPYKFQFMEDNHESQNDKLNIVCNSYRVGETKKDTKITTDKSLIEDLLGKYDEDSIIKEKKNIGDKNNKKKKSTKLNLHNKRKSIKFSIIKKET